MATSNPWTMVAQGLSSGVMLVIRVCEFTYALKAVGEQTKDYLQTAQHVSENLLTARRLLQANQSLPPNQRKDFERIIDETQTAVTAVQVFLEPARVDSNAEQRIRFRTRGMWVLRDSQGITAALSRLQIAHQSLNRVTSTLENFKSSDQHDQPTCHGGEKPTKYASKTDGKKDMILSSDSGGNSLLHWRRSQRMSPPAHPPTRSETPTLPIQSKTDADVNVYEMFSLSWDPNEIPAISPMSSTLTLVPFEGIKMLSNIVEGETHELEGSPSYDLVQSGCYLGPDGPIKTQTVSTAADYTVSANSTAAVRDTTASTLEPWRSLPGTPSLSTVSFNHPQRSISYGHSRVHSHDIRSRSRQSTSALEDEKSDESISVTSEPTAERTRRRTWLMHHAQRSQLDLRTRHSGSSLNLTGQSSSSVLNINF